MKIDRFNEDINNNKDLIDARLLSKRFSKEFFSELEEFDRIIVEYDDDNYKPAPYKFSICFSLIYKETIDAIDKFEEFMGYRKDGWVLQFDDFTYDDVPKAFYEFYLAKDNIDKYNKHFDLLDGAKKYNL